MTFQDAVQSTNDVSNAYRPGLQALSASDRSKVICSNTRLLTGSISLDSSLRQRRPHDPRWDYGIGWMRAAQEHHVAWTEVHPASSQHVDAVITKLKWLRTWLQSNARQLNSLPRTFHWVASGAIAMNATHPKRRLINQLGLHLGKCVTIPMIKSKR